MQGVLRKPGSTIVSLTTGGRYNTRLRLHGVLRIRGSSPLFPVSILLLLVQAACIVHVIKTGRNQLWIWAIFLLPGIGAVAYLAAEVLPELFGGRTARRATAGVRRMIDPNRDLRRASAEVE